MLSETLLVLDVHSTDIRPLFVDAATAARKIVMPAYAVSTVEKPGFLGVMDALTTQTALIAGKPHR